MNKKPKPKPPRTNKAGEKWLPVEFGSLRIGRWFKATPNLSTWWVKESIGYATSVNKQLRSTWLPKDVVWVDLNQGLPGLVNV